MYRKIIWLLFFDLIAGACLVQVFTQFLGDVVLPVAGPGIGLLDRSPGVGPQSLGERPLLIGEGEVHAVGHPPVVGGVPRVDGIPVLENLVS